MDSLEWALLSQEHPVLGCEPIDLITLMLSRIQTVPFLTSDDRAVLTEMAMRATDINSHGTRARGLWPGYIRLANDTGLGVVRVMWLCRRLRWLGVLEHDEETWEVGLLAHRWGAWLARDATGRARGTGGMA